MKKFIGVFLLAFVALGRPASADVAFTLTPSTQSIVQGGTGVFNLFVSSASSDLVEGFDFNVNAGAGDGTGGVFLSAPTFLAGSVPGDVTSTPGQAFSTNFTLTPFNLSPTPSLLATLTLDTTGVALGTYQMTLDSLIAAHPTLGALTTTQNFITYEVTAVPEPASLMTGLGLAAAGVFNRRRRRKLH